MIELSLTCDGLKCGMQYMTEIDDQDDIGQLVKTADWIADPENPEFVYCLKCKPEVEKEFKERDNE